MLSSLHGQTSFVRALLNKGADVNARENGGETALIMAAGRGSREGVEALLASNADNNPKTNDGRTALGMATRGDRRDVMALLAKAGAKQ
jgi:ankyrin repeat protein